MYRTCTEGRLDDRDKSLQLAIPKHVLQAGWLNLKMCFDIYTFFKYILFTNA